jgi:hypothetical protein
MTEQRAFTITEAAQLLQVTPQWVSQMLRSGTLNGPDAGPGRARKHAPRVWEGSLQEEISRRTAKRHITDQPAADPGPDVSKPSKPRGQVIRSAREATAVEAALRLKISLDTAREALRRERQVNKRLTTLLAAATAELQAAQTQADRLDDIAVGYSEALTQFLIPDPSDGVSLRPWPD